MVTIRSPLEYMKKHSAIIIAVILAIVVAMADHIVETGFSGGSFSWNNIKTIFGMNNSGEISIAKTPKIPKKIEPNLTYDEYITKGDYYYKRGFLSYASGEYIKAINSDSTKTKAYFKLMQTNFDLMNYEKARNNANQILSLESSNFQAQYFLVLINIKQSKFLEAQKLIDQLNASGAVDHRLTYFKSLIHITYGKHEDGKKLLVSLSKDATLDSKLDLKVKKILKGYQEFEFAKAAESLYLSELLARGLNQVGEYEMAVYKIKNILRVRADLRDSWIMLGFSYLNLKNYLFALNAFEKAYKLDSEWASTQYFLGVTYSELQKYNDAIIYLNYALTNGFTPKLVVQQKLADLYLKVKDYKKSVAAYEQVLSTNKQDINSFVRPIWIYLDFLNEPAKAVKLGEIAVQNFPTNPQAYNLLGWSQVGTKNYIEAEKNLKKAIQDDPKMAAAHYNLAKLYEVQDKKDLAMESYQKAYTLDQSGSIGNLAAKRYNTLLLK